jgi:protein-L-isoaspartate(D-aspartate) O-methyltransferase
MHGKGLVMMVRCLEASGYLKSRGVRDAMLAVDRAHFVPESERALAYADTALPLGYGQTISAPGVVAFMLERLEIKKGMKVLEIGTGSGYNCCLLSRLVGPGGRVTTVDIMPELSDAAKSNCAKSGVPCRNVEFVAGDGSRGYEPNAPYDRIMVTAAMPSLGFSHPLMGQLKRDGKLIAPVGTILYQDLMLFDRKSGRRDLVLPVMFVPLIGKYGFRKD